MLRNYSISTLEKRLQKLKDRLEKEQARTTQVMNNIGWGTGMRCTKCTPSFAKTVEIKAKIEEVKAILEEKKQ